MDRYTQAQNAAASTLQPAEENNVRTPLDLVEVAIFNMISLVDSLEERISGSAPREVSLGSRSASVAEAPYVGLHAHAGRLSPALTCLNQRLETLLQRL